jgi:hypothetical protein
MVLVTFNPEKQLLYVQCVGAVTPAELEHACEEISSLTAKLNPGYSALINLAELQSMGRDCVTIISRIMEVKDRSGVGMVLRVIPDTQKDVGLSILSLFHYSSHPRLVTCASMHEAVLLLGR